MKITETLLSIPPYLSTTWEHIASLHANHSELTVTLENGTEVVIPNLDANTLNEIFEAHSRYSNPQPSSKALPPFSFSIPIKADSSLDLLTPNMHHDPEQRDAPLLPPEVLNKLIEIARAFGLEDFSSAPPPEPGCQCIYCQLASNLLQSDAPVEEEEEVTEADLHFRDWEVAQTEKNLYCVTNPLEASEQYTVFLGEPLGCTCGEKNCEHIRAVLCSE